MTEYQKLEKLISDARALIEKQVTNSNTDFEAWEVNVRRFLSKKYGEKSIEYKKFDDTSFFSGCWGIDTTDEEFHSDCVNSCREGLEITIAILQSYLDDFSDSDTNEGTRPPHNSKKVFIVHGHDGELKQAVARIIEKQGIEAIILSEQANKGRTIIEKFEDYSDVSGAICLFTADDYGRAKNNTTDNTRARQNVVLEAGYFMGKLGRNCVAILADKDIEMPSALSGIVYTDSTNWEINLLKELKEMGYTIDFNKLF